MRLYLRLSLGLLRRLLGPRRDLLMENLVLRQQLAVFERRRPRPALRNEDRIFWSLVARSWSPWRSHLRLVQPDTVIRWHRTAWRRYWAWKSRRRQPGRPRIDAELRELIIRLARENPRWGAVRIVGELRALGFAVSARTVRRYRDTARRRPPSQSWRTFLHNHSAHMWAVDLFTVQTISMRTLYAVVFISHERRRIEHVNVTAHPTAAWLRRQLIEATPWGAQPRFLIRDRDRSYGGDWVAWTDRLGIRSVLTPVRAPNANAIAERAIGTIRRECLDHVLVLNERHLRHVLRAFVQHYNSQRPHRSLSLDAPDRREPQRKPRPSALVQRREVLGGLIHEYDWAA
jgi:transposase InsO family protein